MRVPIKIQELPSKIVPKCKLFAVHFFLEHYVHTFFLILGSFA